MLYNKHKMDANEPVRVDYYNTKTSVIVRLTGLISPIIAITYGFLVRFDVLKIPHATPNPAFGNWDLYIISILLMTLGLWQLLFPVKLKLGGVGILSQVFTYQILLGALLIFITGLTPPFIAFWVLLAMETWVYLKEKGFRLSMLLFTMVVFIDVCIYNNPNTESVIYGIVCVLMIYFATLVQIRLNINNANKKAMVAASKSKESLQRDQFLTIINNLTDAVISINMEGMVRTYNAASLDLLDTNIDLAGKNIDELFVLTDENNNQVSILKDIKNAKTIVNRDDLTYNFGDGEKMRLEITFSPIRNNYDQSKKLETHDGYILIARDITKSKSLEEERDEFVSVVSHELRTPITIAEGTISNVQTMSGHPNVTPKMIKDNVNLAHEQVIFLADMVNDLSSLSRADQGMADDTQDIDVAQLTKELADKYSDEATAKKLKLELDLTPKLGTAHASKLYVEELLQNFITNAIKYTKKGKVTIIAHRNKGNIDFSVSDTGIGISKPDQAKIFDKFYRSEDSRTQEVSGTGLGLYVAAKLANKLKTKLTLTSRLNSGSTFGFSLPEVKNGK